MPASRLRGAVAGRYPADYPDPIQWGLSFDPEREQIIGARGFAVIFDYGTELVEIAGPRWVIPARFRFLWNPGAGPRIALDLSVSDYGFACDALHVLRREGDRPLTATELRTAANVPTFIKNVVAPRATLEREDDSTFNVGTALRDSSGFTADRDKNAKPTPQRGKRITDEQLQYVADVYTEALKQGRPPVKEVERTLEHYSRSNVGRLVFLARKRGYLPKTERGQARADVTIVGVQAKAKASIKGGKSRGK